MGPPHYTLRGKAALGDDLEREKAIALCVLPETIAKIEPTPPEVPKHDLQMGACPVLPLSQPTRATWHGHKPARNDSNLVLPGDRAKLADAWRSVRGPLCFRKLFGGPNPYFDTYPNNLAVQNGVALRVAGVGSSLSKDFGKKDSQSKGAAKGDECLYCSKRGRRKKEDCYAFTRDESKILQTR